MIWYLSCYIHLLEAVVLSILAKFVVILLYLPPSLFFFLPLLLLLLFAFLFDLLLPSSLTRIISIFYSLNYTSRLLHIITAHLIPHLSLSIIIFIIFTLIIGIFYCFDCTSLLLHSVICYKLYISFSISILDWISI